MGSNFPYYFKTKKDQFTVGFLQLSLIPGHQSAGFERWHHSLDFKEAELPDRVTAETAADVSRICKLASLSSIGYWRPAFPLPRPTLEVTAFQSTELFFWQFLSSFNQILMEGTPLPERIVVNVVFHQYLQFPHHTYLAFSIPFISCLVLTPLIFHYHFCPGFRRYWQRREPLNFFSE